MYALVLEKAGSKPLLYIGPSTSAAQGVRQRFHQYDILILLPYYVLKAIDDGYTITSKGLLLHCQSPSAGQVPMLRLTFVAMEAAVSYLFWAHKTLTKDAACVVLCPWERASLEWHGLCSHNPLTEGVSGNFNLTKEQLEEMAAIIKEKSIAYRKAHKRAQRERSPERIHERIITSLQPPPTS